MIRQTVTAAVLIGLTTLSAAAQPSDRPGRFSMAPVAGGAFARLDTVTGTMSICQGRDGDWACRDVEDDSRGLRQDNDRLASENRQLKGELRRLEERAVGGSGRGVEQPQAERPGGQFKLPSEQDLDQAFSYFERMLKKFRDKLREFDASKGSTPL